MSDAAEISLQPPPPPRPPRPPRGRVLAGIIAAVAVFAGGVFAVTSLDDDGANSPEDPVRAMFAAVEQGDILGALGELAPGERDAVRGPLADLVDELNRLDVLKGATLAHLTGLDVAIEGLELASERVRDDVARVTITGGRGRYEFDPAQLPLGGFVRSLVGDQLRGATSSGGGPLASEGSDDFIATVKRGSRWYVSLGYTIAELARQSAGRSFDDLGRGVPAHGAQTPEGAVRDLITAATNFDVRRMIELLPPDELGAVQEYAELFLDELLRGANQARGQLQATVPVLELEADTSGNHATVKVTEIAFDLAGEGISMSYRDGCVDMTTPDGESRHLCEDDDPGALLESLGFPIDFAAPVLSFENKRPEVGIVAVEVDGRWYISPTRTMLESLVEVVRLFERRDLDALRTWVEDFFGMFAGTTY